MSDQDLKKTVQKLHRRIQKLEGRAQHSIGFDYGYMAGLREGYKMREKKIKEATK